MDLCDGTWVVHQDGTSAACSEEISGRPCAGSGAAHRGGTATCETLLGPGACEWCALGSWESRDWRHAAHVGRMARAQRRCRVAHIGVQAMDSGRPLSSGLLEPATRP